jgi:uncharacterized protein YndB with AHSA1/START domain
MPDILHRVGAAAPPQRVYQALTTLEGLRGWWIADTQGDPRPGGTIDFGFTDMQVVESAPDRRVRWRCTRGPQEWVGTEVTFDLSPKEGQTFVVFKHSGWKEPVEFMHHCSTKWAIFLMSLKSLIETGTGNPDPDDVKIDNWN